jgi:RimJ/RimL family protein N-acetyltransferase
VPFPTLETERLIIRGFEISDLNPIHAILDQAWEHLTLNQRRDWLYWTVLNDTQLARLYQPPYGEKAVVLKESGLLIGAVGLVQAVIPATHFDPQPRPTTLVRPEMGLFWAFDLAFQGQGYATEAAQRVIEFIFADLRFERVIATTEYDNEQSQAVMRRLGMDVKRNPFPDPFWCQIVAFLDNPEMLG